MKLLLIEDDPNKLKNLHSFLSENYPSSQVTSCRSYQSGLQSLMKGDFDLILLDMQLPTFDIKFGEDGHKFRKTAGIDILNEVKRKVKKAQVLIVTQYETFGEGEGYLSLNDLKRQLKRDFPTLYLDTVFYDPRSLTWKENLKNILNGYTNG